MVRLIVSTIIIWQLFSCAGGDKKISSPAQEQEEDEKHSASFEALVYSLSNNNMTSRRIDRQKARSLANKLSQEAQRKPGRYIFAEAIAAQRFARSASNDILRTARKAAEFSMAKGVQFDLSNRIKLELALAAISIKNFTLADFYLEDLARSARPRVKAGALNALGVIALLEGQVPEAVRHWQQALKVVSGYEASLLNLGFIGLAYGDYELAQNSLSLIDHDWFASSGLIVASRHLGDIEQASILCEKLESRHHKPTLFNCGVHEWQSNNNSVQAKELIKKAMSLPGGASTWRSSGDKTLLKIP